MELEHTRKFLTSRDVLPLTIEKTGWEETTRTSRADAGIQGKSSSWIREQLEDDAMRAKWKKKRKRREKKKRQRRRARYK